MGLLLETDRRTLLQAGKSAAGISSFHQLIKQVEFIRLIFILCCVFFIVLPKSVSALEPIQIVPGQEQIEITHLGEFYEGRGDRLQVETAPGIDGIAGRMEITALNAGTNPNWVVFALNNPTESKIERWITAERYSMIGSGVFWPTLDSRHISQITPSLGFRPERIENDSVDIFRIELAPRATVTYIAEINSSNFPRIYVWQPQAFEKRARDFTLFKGILLGVTGLLAVFLTAIFVANHRAIFPSAALIAWSVVAYLCVDFGFWHKLFQLVADNNAIYRAAAESAIAANFVLFLYTFLRLSLWHGWIRLTFLGWYIAQLSLIILAILDPVLAAGFARVSFLVISVVGALLIVYLSVRGQDRALALVPSWLLFLVWIFGASVTIIGQLSGDIAVAGVISGLVLIVILLGFTVTQYAFHSFEPMYGGGLPGQLQQRSLAIEGANAAVFEWNARRDEISVSEDVELALRLAPGSLNCRVDDFLIHLHPADQERFRILLWTLQEQNGGEFNLDFRIRRSDSSYLWFELRAHSVPSNQYRSLKCIGLMRDVTNSKRAHERLLHDAVHDSLTGMPNRELLLDRLGTAITRSNEEGANRPTVLFIDIDRFKNVNTSMGLAVGDSMLLTVARRLARHLNPLDTIARIGGDQFGILLVTETEPRQIAMFAERARRSLRSPMKFSGKEIILTSSIGIAVYDGSQPTQADVLREAELAMYAAKRSGADRVEIFRPEMRSDKDNRANFESDLKRAIDRRQLQIFYQPIIDLEDEEVVGFETLVRWNHPSFGILMPEDFNRISEDTAYLRDLGTFVLDQATRQVARWHKAFPGRENPLFVTVNITGGEVFRYDLVQDIRLILRRDAIPKGTLRLEVKESLVLENPEQSAEILEWLRGAGASLILDDFGTGFSSISYLSRFPFESVKIDNSFIQQIGSSQKDLAVVRSMVAMLHELDKVVIAQGIESVEDASYLRSIKCQMGQGYLYGEPMTDKEVMSLLSAIAKANKKQEKRQLSLLRRSNKNLQESPVSDSQKTGKPIGKPLFKSPDTRPGASTGRPLLNLPNPTKAQSGAG